MSWTSPTAAIVVAVLCGVLVVFQLALAGGAPWGRAAYGGQNPGTLPTSLRVASVVSAVVFAAAGLVVLRRSGLEVWSPLPDETLPVAVWVLVGVFALSVLMNAITRSRLERSIWLPVAIVLCAATLVVALGV